ncbi:hypothetical protein VNI00_012065 [Paramarasmius palmivorus]|uniref:Thioredoxin-like protein AAED1 n=1 Tax=Paramarasmius palmivorus TaxID=297713 RepID=A0AAW0CAB2_9AGAR
MTLPRRPRTSPARISQFSTSTFVVPRKPVPQYDPSEFGDYYHHETDRVLVKTFSEDLYHASHQSLIESFQEDSDVRDVESVGSQIQEAPQPLHRRRALTIPNKDFATPPMSLRLPNSIQPLNLAGISGILSPITSAKADFPLPLNLAYTQFQKSFEHQSVSPYASDASSTHTTRGMITLLHEAQLRRKERGRSLSKASIATEHTVSSITESFLPSDLIDTSSPGFDTFNDLWQQEYDDDDERTVYLTNSTPRSMTCGNTQHADLCSGSISNSRPILTADSQHVSINSSKYPLGSETQNEYRTIQSQSKISILSVDKATPAVPDTSIIPSDIIDTSSISEQVDLERLWGYDDDEKTLYAAGPSCSRPISRGSAFSSEKNQKRASANLHVRFTDVPQEVDSPESSFSDNAPFEEYGIPTREQLRHAEQLCVISESGVRVPFGDLWKNQKTVVIFIRHFLCPLCQDYMFSISRNISADMLKDEGIQLVIIGNGCYELIKYYRKIFRSPFAIYTDPGREVYNAMGMTLETLEKGPRSSYIRHGAVGGFGMVLANAVKVNMPIWKNSGKIAQLGGEFILGPGPTCSFAHRMRYTRAHLPILDIVREAGVDMLTPLNMLMETTGNTFLGIPVAQEAQWMIKRKRELALIRDKRRARRGGGEKWCENPSNPSTESHL